MSEYVNGVRGSIELNPAMCTFSIDVVIELMRFSGKHLRVASMKVQPRRVHVMP